MKKQMDKTMRIWRGTNDGGVWGLFYSSPVARPSPSTNISKHEAKCHLEREQMEIKHTEHHILSLSISGNGFSLAFNQRHTEEHYHPLRRVCSCGCANCYTVYSKHWPLITSALLETQNHSECTCGQRVAVDPANCNLETHQQIISLYDLLYCFLKRPFKVSSSDLKEERNRLK